MPWEQAVSAGTAQGNRNSRSRDLLLLQGDSGTPQHKYRGRRDGEVCHTHTEAPHNSAATPHGKASAFRLQDKPVPSPNRRSPYQTDPCSLQLRHPAAQGLEGTTAIRRRPESTRPALNKLHLPGCVNVFRHKHFQTVLKHQATLTQRSLKCK